MVLQRLKDDTRADHEQIERSVDLTNRLSTRAGYRAVLAQFYGFYTPMEAALARVEGLALALEDLDARWKTGLLARDLLALGLTADDLAALPHCADLPALPEVTRALGCLYVLEGATLGGQLITRQLGGALGLTPDSGGAFFAGYGPQTGPMWRSFGARLVACAPTAAHETAMVTAARETFHALDRWLGGKT